uniref:mRNA (guanine-N(7))-methyltransferase n=1 Tax=Strigamia maritima TaxID=126957 RepID=T1ILN2_STRMM
MLRNASECLKPGGYFIGTTPDSCEIVKRLKQCDDLSYGNDVYRVTFKDKENFSLFGAEYNFYLTQVVDCPEFLVYFPALIEIAQRYGLEFMFKTRFDDYFHECLNHSNHRKRNDARQLVGRMQALETFPSFDETDLMSSLPDDYRNAKNALEKLQYCDGGSRIGPLVPAGLERSSCTLCAVACAHLLDRGTCAMISHNENGDFRLRRGRLLLLYSS